MVDRHTYTCTCGERPRIDWQGKYRKAEDAWIEYDGFWIVTCWTRDCGMYGMTLTLDNHATQAAKRREANR